MSPPVLTASFMLANVVVGSGARAPRISFAGAAALVLSAGPLLAQEDVEPLAVAYQAPEDCPDASAFAAEIMARTSRARFVQTDQTARIMHVVITRTRSGYSGRLSMEDASSKASPREVSAATCADVASALGLIGALAVDPRASVAPRPLPSGGASRGPAAPATEDAQTREPVRQDGKDRRSDASEARPSAPAPPVEPTGARAGPREPGPLEAGLQGEVAFLAGAVVSGRLFAGVALRDGPKTRRGFAFAPALRIAFGRSLLVERSAVVGGADLQWTVGSLDLCPVRLGLATGLGLRPCAEFGAGLLEAHGREVASAMERSRPWAALSAYARLLWEPLSRSPPSPRLSVEAEVGAQAPLVRESFFFNPDVSVYEAPAAAFLARLGLGVRFP